MTSMLLIADVGGLGHDCRWHVGDEAMLAADLAWLRTEVPGIDLVAASTAPAWTRRLYGVRATGFLDFGDHTTTGEAREMCRAIATGKASVRDALAQPARRLRKTMTAVDSVLFCGAGNLSSAFPNRLYERIAAARLAAATATPYAFIGQTVGPLTDEDAAQLRGVLAGAVFVGIRDRESAELLGALGVRAVPMQDDAMHPPMASRHAADAGFPAMADGTRRIGVTLHQSSQAQHKLDIESIANAIGRVAVSIGATVRFIPHFRAPADRWSDRQPGAELASHLPVPVEFMPWEPIDRVRADTAACSLVISTRYHPLVFAACAGIPAIGLYQDTYHRAKFSGVRYGREARYLMFPASAEGSSQAAEAGLVLACGSAAAEVTERHRLMIEQDARIRRNCLDTLRRGR